MAVAVAAGGVTVGVAVGTIGVSVGGPTSTVNVVLAVVFVVVLTARMVPGPGGAVAGITMARVNVEPSV